MSRPTNPRPAVTSYISSRTINEGTYPSLAVLIRQISEQVNSYGALDKVPAAAAQNVRNDMYLASEALRFLLKDKENNLSKDDVAKTTAFKGSLDNATHFIPLWVKIAVAIALGLGTMIGWKRIVVTVGEKIGKTHLTYAQGASAEIVAMGVSTSFLQRRSNGVRDRRGIPMSFGKARFFAPSFLRSTCRQRAAKIIIGEVSRVSFLTTL